MAAMGGNHGIMECLSKTGEGQDELWKTMCVDHVKVHKKVMMVMRTMMMMMMMMMMNLPEFHLHSRCARLFNEGFMVFHGDTRREHKR